MVVLINKRFLQCFFHSVFVIVFLVGVFCPHLPAAEFIEDRGLTVNVTHTKDKPSGLPKFATFAEDNFDNWDLEEKLDYTRQMGSNITAFFVEVEVRSSDEVDGFGGSGKYLRMFDNTWVLFKHEQLPDFEFDYLQFWFSPSNPHNRIYLMDRANRVIFEIDLRHDLGDHWIVAQPRGFTFAGVLISVPRRREGHRMNLDELLVGRKL